MTQNNLIRSIEKLAATSIDYKLTDIRLTPLEAVEALEARFELGEKTHAGHAWNAYTNQEKLDDKDWIVDRISHAKAHMEHYLYVLNGIIPDNDIPPDNGDDDGAAIMWLGCMLHMAYKRRKQNEYKT